MLDKKLIRLNFEGKRCVMEFMLKKIGQEKSSSEKDKPDVSKFLRLLAISKSFLYASRYYKIYRFNYEVSNFTFRSFLTGPENCHNEPNSPKHEIQFDENDFALIKFLDPKFVGFYVKDEIDEEDEEILNTLDHLMEITKGNIGLFLTQSYGSTWHHSFIEKFSTRIRELECEYADFLEDKQLKLDYYKLCHIKNVGELSKFLGCKINFNALQLDVDSNWKRGGKSTLDHKNFHVQQITLTLQNYNMQYLLTVIIDELIEMLPNLKQIDINASFDFKKDQHPDRKIESCNEFMENLKLHFVKKEVKFSINFELNFEKELREPYKTTLFDTKLLCLISGLQKYNIGGSEKYWDQYDETNKMSVFAKVMDHKAENCSFGIGILYDLGGGPPQECPFAKKSKSSEKLDYMFYAENCKNCHNHSFI